MENECIHNMPRDWCAICNGSWLKFQEESKEPELTFEGLLGTDENNG